MITTTDRALGWRALLVAVTAGIFAGCGAPAGEEPSAPAESWSVTVWGERFEVFPEVDPLVAGETAVAHTHVTRLEEFAPLVEGGVEIVFVGGGSEEVFAADEPVRPGIFSVEIEPSIPGEFDLIFRIRDAGGDEEIRGGRVRVGESASPGGLLVAPAPKGAGDGGEPVSFLKEQQWRSDFGTAWVRTGRLARGLSGVARVRPPAGGEITVTAPVAGVVQAPAAADSWPYVGRPIARGAGLFRLVPLVAPDRSLPALEADLATITTELETARARRARLEELLELEAVSRREVEEARDRAETLEARREAAARDLAAARASRESGATSDALLLKAPFRGEVARLLATPGATVGAGEPLARLVRTDVVWIEALLAPSDAAEIRAAGSVRGVVLTDPERAPRRLEEGVRLVSVAPEVSPETGTVTVLLEAPPAAGVALGTTLEAQILAAEELEGIVVPASALVDDGGVPVVYLQLSGESFARQEVHVSEHQGDLVLVERLLPGQRLVTRGGDAIRRSSLMASGEAQGHVH